MSYSFTALYRSDTENEKIELINKKYLKVIKLMNLNNNTISLNSYYTFPLPGEYKIDFFMDISSISSLNKMFNGITKMISISFRDTKLSSNDVSFFDTSKITDFSEMFTHCSSLTSIDIANFETINAKNIEFMFSSCPSLT